MAELFLDLEIVFRRCDFEFFETGEREVKIAPFPEPGTKGVRARVKYVVEGGRCRRVE